MQAEKQKEVKDNIPKKTPSQKMQKDIVNKKKKFREDKLSINEQQFNNLQVQKEQPANLQQSSEKTKVEKPQKINSEGSKQQQKQKLNATSDHSSSPNKENFQNTQQNKQIKEQKPQISSFESKNSIKKQSENTNNNQNETSSDQEDQQRQFTDQFDTDGYLTSDKDLFNFKRENLMRIKRDNSDFEEEIINQIEREDKKKRQENNPIEEEEETDEMGNSQNESNSNNDDYSDEQEEKAHILLNTLEDQQYRKQIITDANRPRTKSELILYNSSDEDYDEEEGLPFFKSQKLKKQLSSTLTNDPKNEEKSQLIEEIKSKSNNNSQNNSASKKFPVLNKGGDIIKRKNSQPTKKKNSVQLTDAIQQQIQKQFQQRQLIEKTVSEPVKQQQQSASKKSLKLAQLAEYDKDINEGDDDEDDDQQHTHTDDEQISLQEKNLQKQKSELNELDKKKQIKLTSQHLQQQQEKRKTEIEKRKSKKKYHKEQIKEQEQLIQIEKLKRKQKQPFDWRIYNRLLKYTIQEYKLAIPAYLFMIAMAGTQIFVPRQVGDLLDATIKEKNLELLDEIAYQSLMIFILHGTFDFFRTYFYNLLGERIVINLRNDCFRTFMLADIEFHDKHNSGELLSRISSDAIAAKGAASGNLGNLIRNTLLSIGYVLILIYTSWRLSIVILLCVPIFISSSNYCGSTTKSMVSQYQKVLSKTTQLAAECFLNIRTVKSFSNEELEINRFDKKQSKGFILGQKKCLSLGMHNGMESLLSNMAKLCVLWYGGYLVIQNEHLTSGQLASFILYTNSLASSASSITSCLQKIVIATGSSKRLFKMIDMEPKIRHKGGQQLQKNDARIEFNDVAFFYPESAMPTLDQFNLVIEPGEQVAFVGPSGSGKSTIIRLIERFYDVNKGCIKIGGQNIKDLDLFELRNYIGYVSQEPVLFSGTIESNLTYGVGQEYTEAELDEVSKQACAYNFIHDKNLFPKGYRTQVGQQGAKLSGGQKQRIAIARALLKRPKILIFDEATSALDAESEFQVQEAIDKLMTESSMTIIIIAHRLSTILNCEKIVVLSRGKIEGIGSHYELLQGNDIYRNLIERQMNPMKNSIINEISGNKQEQQ